MKVLVDKMPTNPKECLFATLGFLDVGRKSKAVPKCSMDDTLCDFVKGHGCNKLKIIK